MYFECLQREEAHCYLIGPQLGSFSGFFKKTGVFLLTPTMVWPKEELFSHSFPAGSSQMLPRPPSVFTSLCFRRNTFFSNILFLTGQLALCRPGTVRTSPFTFPPAGQALLLAPEVFARLPNKQGCVPGPSVKAFQRKWPQQAPPHQSVPHQPRLHGSCNLQTINCQEKVKCDPM